MKCTAFPYYLNIIIDFLISKNLTFFKGAETSASCNTAGISTSGESVNSDYFSRLARLKDFRVATAVDGGYHYPYLDFGITEIYQKFYFVIGTSSFVHRMLYPRQFNYFF